MMKEIYLPVNIDLYKDKYLVSNLGNVKSVNRNIIMKPYPRNGYDSIGLSSDGKAKNLMNHRLVALTFLSNDDKLEHVNHKEGNKSNNIESNLEWCSRSDNAIHSQKVLGKTRSTKAVRQLDLNGNFIREFISAAEVERLTGISAKHIPAVCKGTRKTAEKFKWEYVNEIDKITIEAPVGKEREGYPNYIITSKGQIYSKNIKNFLVLNKQESGYETIGLCNCKKKDFYVHILVAELYLEFVEGKTKVNHKDKNKSNNDVENLEWVTQTENMFHHHGTKNMFDDIPVIKYDKKHKEIKRYNSIRDASTDNNNLYKGSIKKACEGIYNTAGGYIWKWV